MGKAPSAETDVVELKAPEQFHLFQLQTCSSYLWPSTVHKDTPHSSGLNLASWGM